MEFKLTFDFQSAVRLEHGKPVFLFGSCFSDNLKPHFENSGIEVISNPFGTIFHPTVLARIIQKAIQGEPFDRRNVNDIWLSFDASSKLNATSQDRLSDNLNSASSELLRGVQKAQMIVVTLGTCIGYRHSEDDLLVSNCHKIPQRAFTKALSDLDPMIAIWTETIDLIRSVNPQIQIVFTVSPVRHKKDGLIENNRSKARLIELVNALNPHNYVSYFPSYEIVIDELRDYRFFEKDLVHPNDLAVSYVWQRLKETMGTEEFLKNSDRVVKLNRMRDHRLQSDDKMKIQEHEEKIIREMESLNAEISGIYWK